MRDALKEPEEWRQIAGYEGLYDVSSHGRVRTYYRHGRGSPLSAMPIPKAGSPGGAFGQYRKVSLFKDQKSKTFYVHRLVAHEFLPPCPPGHEVAHDDGIGHHNAWTNLAWKTRKANHSDKRRHGTHLYGERVPWSKLTADQVREIRTIPASIPLKEVAQKYGVSTYPIWSIRNDKCWRETI